MKVFAALAAGYVLGSRAGREDIDSIISSLRAIKETEEFNDLLTSLRSHAVHSLRELAAVVERGILSDADRDAAAIEPVTAHDLVERVRHLAGLR